ncbi:hypothetical protein NFI96_002406 [Prochilodus magdalenae]|nr:hypothetical protein NFI96_002406 [Prochilodus magdalenae]
MDVNGKAAPLYRTASDRNFQVSLNEFIESEKERLGCQTEAPDERRYTVYSAAFDKVIDHATAYKPILTAIKKEYDEFIASVKTNERQAKFDRGKFKAMVARPTSLMYCQRRAAQLQERIAFIQRDTAAIQAKMKRLQEYRKNLRDSEQPNASDDRAQNPVGQIPGLEFSDYLNPEALEEHLRFLEQKRADFLSKKTSQYVPVQVKHELDIKLKTILNQQDELDFENNKLRLRFSALFEVGEYEAAAYHAVKSPHGVLRNMDTVERFKSVTVYEGELPPVLLFFQALMISVQPGKHLPGEVLSLEGVRCALQQGCLDLSPDMSTDNSTDHQRAVIAKLTYSEELGDVICSHGDKDPRVADTCLALGHIVYTACGVLRKAALSMCRRGLTSGALELIYRHRDFTVEDCMFVLRGCPSLALMQDFTQLYEDKPALLSVGFVCHSLLYSDLEDLAFQLLQKIYDRGHGALVKAILDDVMCNVESWSEVAARCEQRERPQLAQEIISTLLSQPGAMCLLQEQDSAKLMEHVFM